MAMNVNSINSQNPAQLYQNNQTETTHGPQQNTTQSTTLNANSTRVDISQRARELQTQSLQGRQEAGEAERTADNERTEQAQSTTNRQEIQNAGNQAQTTAGTRNPINLVA